MTFYTKTLAEGVRLTSLILDVWLSQPTDDERENLRLSGARLRFERMGKGVMRIQWVEGPNWWMCTLDEFA